MNRGLFLPGWGAPASLYRRAVPAGWEVLEPPRFRQTGGKLEPYLTWLLAELREPVTLAGHSMGGALAIRAALERPVERLVLVSPAGLPLRKPLHRSALTFARQLLHRSYPLRSLTEMAAGTLGSPRSALALARAVHDLDLTHELERLRAQGTPCTVIACVTDELTTPAHCRELAERLGAEYREVDACDGHIWVVTQPELLRAELERDGPVAGPASISLRRRLPP
jgi:pimeloyl-ACP methyl ester carboxylesterase